MTINSEQIQALKAAADDIGSEEWQYMRSSNFSNGYITNSEGKTVVNVTDGDVPARYARFIELANPVAILSLLAEREADKALIAEQAKRIAELEARTVTVKLPQRCECCYSEKEAALFDGVVEEYTEALESACAAAGIPLVLGE